MKNKLPVGKTKEERTQEFYKLIDEIKNTKDIAILIISHDFEYVRQYADKVVLINKKVLKSGTPEQVLTSSEFKNEFGMEVV